MIISIYILDDYSLLNMFYLYRPSFRGEDTDDFNHFQGGRGRWVQGRWWYQLAHVCQIRRKLILGSASYLDLSLVCTNGTPVENMLALTIDYIGEDGITAEDEEGVLLTLEQRHRVHHLRFVFPVQNLQKLVMAIKRGISYPGILYLIVYHLTKNSTLLVLPETL
jgi:hypothetical protein